MFRALLIAFTVILFSGSVRGAEYTVAIDAGHGGSNLGAKTQNQTIFEKHLTLTLAKKIKAHLAKEKDLRVLLCRSTDVFFPIRARVRCANEARARLFLSIHANAVGPDRPAGGDRGFELYILPIEEVDKEVIRKSLLAPSDEDAAFEGYWVRSQAAQSLIAARRIEWRLADALGRESNRGIKQKGATLDVLKGLDMPAVLVEVGYLDHPEEGATLLTDKAQETIAQSLALAITDLRARERRGQKEPMTTSQKPGRKDMPAPSP